MICLSLCRVAVLIAIPLTLVAQGNNQTPAEDKRILWLFTNHRTIEDSISVPKLTPKGKFAIAFEDATDPAVFLQSAFIAGIGQATNSNPSFGQGVAGYARRFGTSYGDFAIQNMMTEAVFPTLLHQDPRYRRRHGGSGRARLGYAISRLVITRTDSGKHQFNYSEVLGGATSLAISTSYHPDGRNVADLMQRYSLQLGFDAASNVLKEFWPDLKRKLPRRLVSH